MAGMTQISSRRVLAWAATLAVAVFALATAGQAVAGDQVPFKGSDSGSWGGGTHDCSGLFAVVVNTGGTATHVGRYTYSSSECVDFSSSTYAGRFEITAADGSSIRGTYAGSFTVAGDFIAYEQENTVTGGSSRFVGASGGFHVSGLASLIDFSDVQVLDGAISSIGSTN